MGRGAQGAVSASFDGHYTLNLFNFSASIGLDGHATVASFFVFPWFFVARQSRGLESTAP